MLLPFTGYNKQRDKLFFFVRRRSRSGRKSTRARASASCRRSGSGTATSASSLASQRQQPRTSRSARADSRRVPGCRHSRRRATTCRPYIDPLGRCWPTCIRCRTIGRQTTATTTSTAARADQPPRHEGAVRLEHHATTRRRTSASRASTRTSRGARGVWWGASDVAAADARTSARTLAARSRGNIVSVLSPTMTNEALVTCSRLTLDNTYKDPAKMRLRHLRRRFPARSDAEPVHPWRHPELGRRRQQHVERRRTTCMRTTTS